MRSSRLALEELWLVAKVYLALTFAVVNIIGAAIEVIEAVWR